ncbi:MAG: hypothetical protein H6654_12100 [Ardenticatenaceae bacterium]|nr:hypothetical protein [Anaerolineales bacterium]MCB8937723.1 hypothetical protein [Ardenticatenaceae bacterium]MCB8974292.1 hypothetical protein [Ardenticatenaceae bacterium]
MKIKLVPFLIILLTAVFVTQIFLLSTPAPVTALPPRPTATAVPPPAAPGAKISLLVAGEIAANNWTKVQWQDGEGQWHDVTGWQGELELDGTKTWWVGADLLGSGPFRWIVLAEGEQIGQSATFNLPTTLYETVEITISVSE